METLTTPAQKLLTVAANLGWTREEIAEVCGVHPVTVNKWQNGVQPGFNTLLPLLHAVEEDD